MKLKRKVAFFSATFEMNICVITCPNKRGFMANRASRISFTKEKFIGNPAGVITNADGLTDNEMQKIARELNNSETAFIFSSDNKEYDVHIRFLPNQSVGIQRLW